MDEGTGNAAKRLLSWWRDELGITGLETAIVLIAFVVVATVFAFTILSAGLLTTQRSEETILGGLQETGATMMIRGSVIANKWALVDFVESVVFQVGNTSRTGSDINLSRSGNNATLITYIDEDLTRNMLESEWLATWLLGSGDLLSPGEAR